MQETGPDLRVDTKTQRIRMELLRLRERLRPRRQGRARLTRGDDQPRTPEDSAGAIVDILV